MNISEVLAKVREIKTSVESGMVAWTGITIQDHNGLWLCAQVERDQAELARLRAAQILIDACADAQANGEPLPISVDESTSVLVDAGAASIQRLLETCEICRDPEACITGLQPCELAGWLTTPAPQQTLPPCHIIGGNDGSWCTVCKAEGNPPECPRATGESAMERGRVVLPDLVSSYSLSSYAVAMMLESVGAAITEAEQAARAEAFAAVVAWHDDQMDRHADLAPLDSKSHDAALVHRDSRDHFSALAARPPQPQKPEE